MVRCSHYIYCEAQGSTCCHSKPHLPHRNRKFDSCASAKCDQTNRWVSCIPMFLFEKFIAEDEFSFNDC